MSGAVQAGQRAAVEVLAELCPVVLTREEQEALLRNQSAGGPRKQTQSSKRSYLPIGKAMILAALTISAALVLVKHQNALLKAKTYLTNLFPWLRLNVDLM